MTNVYDKIVEMYKIPIKILVRKHHPIYCIGDAKDLSQFFYEILFNLDLDTLLNKMPLAIYILRMRLFDRLRGDYTSLPDKSVFDPEIEMNQDPESMDEMYANKFDLISRVDGIIMSDVFLDKMKELMRYLDEDELRLLRFYKTYSESNSDIPSDRLVCRELYECNTNSSKFRRIKRNLYEKMYYFFKDYIYIDKE